MNKLPIVSTADIFGLQIGTLQGHSFPELWSRGRKTLGMRLLAFWKRNHQPIFPQEQFFTLKRKLEFLPTAFAVILSAVALLVVQKFE